MVDAGHIMTVPTQQCYRWLGIVLGDEVRKLDVRVVGKDLQPHRLI